MKNSKEAKRIMIEIKNVTKHFSEGSVAALSDVSLTIEDGDIFGLIGTNGAGKSTLLRIMSGVLKPDSGEVLIDGENVFENDNVKRNLCFIPDNVYFAPNETPKSAGELFEAVHPAFDKKRLFLLLQKLSLDPERRINTFSKGMKRQLSILLALCAGTKYIFFDETFDGLDPVMRQTVKGAIVSDVCDEKICPVIASHNLRASIVVIILITVVSIKSVGLLHKGGVLLSNSLDDMKLSVQKVQVVMKNKEDLENLLSELDIVSKDTMGSINILIVRGSHDDIMSKVNSYAPVFAESVPLTLEEVFISETGAGGYDLKDLFV